ncbi:MAG: hypothetical protein OET81_11300 [Desulfobacteraceae bacterium]|nr:hypothetical protein [Desulfobacteraceae bacterium]
MISSINQMDDLEKLFKAATKKHLSDISTLPEELVAYVKQVYLHFITLYLNALRQKENKPSDWFPQTWSIDLELADDMRHFFSDSQHVTKEFFILNAKLDRLGEIDKENQPNLYRHAIGDILKMREQVRGKGK